MKAAVALLLFLSLFRLSFSLYRKHFFVNTLMTWEDAQAYCREYHDDLSTVNTEEAKLLSANPGINHEYFWIGMHMSPNNPQQWIWSGGEDEDIDNWEIGEPNTYTEKCGVVRRSNSKLHNAMCSWTLPFYCMHVFEPILVHQNKTWDEALDYCRQTYTDLASLRSQTIMAEAINNATSSQTAYVWTGLRFMAGHWFWVSGDDLQYKAWSKEGELQCPARNLRCGVLDRENNIWRPNNCEDKLNFLCLKKL
ncbi:macrophage mannose receptor 1-like [Rhinichthys klamathensis goyatoka]|uniref:macrophage mannose receptor 1-like n=1 Tax=Rhinichthys klamathensis goyatoka TaxID=3034132 RepID=UPI0024B5249E|nr:macrophage mannose receptor 1-like [Rhinichthys klamathensis goyatoka]